MSLHAIDALLAELNTKEGRWTHAVCADVAAGEELYRRREREGARDAFRLPRRVGEEPINLFEAPVVHEHRAVHERYVRAAAALDHILYFIRVHADGFFDENVLARRCGFRHPLLVQFCWQRYVHRINTFVREERVVALDPTHRSVQLQLFAERLRIRQLARRDGDKRAALGTNDGSGIFAGYARTAHYANAHCVR
jgi:hypothetical protein